VKVYISPSTCRVHHGFLDESGGTGPAAEGDNFLTVAVLVTSNPRPIELHIKRARKRLRRKPRSVEMKATHSTAKTVSNLLRAIAQEEIEIVVVVLDKRQLKELPQKPEALYREAVGRAVRHCAERWPRLHLILDKRYTKVELRRRLEQAIKARLTNLVSREVRIEHGDSQKSKGLQAVDYVVWAVRQKYEWGDEQFYRIIEPKIVVEEVRKVK